MTTAAPLARVRVTPQGDHRRRPRRKRRPSLRDQAIYRDYHVLCRTQAELAAEHKLSQRRIGQIVQRVEKWQATVCPGADGVPSLDEQQRLEWQLTRARLQEVYRRSLRHDDAQPRFVATVKTSASEGKKAVAKTVRQVRRNGQHLRSALRAAEDLARHNQQPPPKMPDPHRDLWELESMVREGLCQLRRKAEDEGLVPKSREPVNVVLKWMEALTGEWPNIVDPQELAPGQPLAELLRYFFRAAGMTPDGIAIGGDVCYDGARQLKAQFDEALAAYGMIDDGDPCPGAPSVSDHAAASSELPSHASNASNASNVSLPDRPQPIVLQGLSSRA